MARMPMMPVSHKFFLLTDATHSVMEDSLSIRPTYPNFSGIKTVDNKGDQSYNSSRDLVKIGERCQFGIQK
jgi:hypothetical protein